MVIQDILREKHVHLPRKEFIVNYKRQGAKVNKDVRREKKQQTWTNKVVLPTPLVPRTATVQVSISTLSGELDTSVGTRLCHFGQFLAGLRLLITWLVKRKYFHPLLGPGLSTDEREKLFNTSDFAILQVRQSYVINKISNPRTFLSPFQYLFEPTTNTSRWILRPSMALLEMATGSCFCLN